MYNVTITLTDDYDDEELRQSSIWNIYFIIPEEEQQTEEAEDALGVNYADLETILQEVVPFLKLDSFSHQGVLTILFSKEMDPPRDLSIIDSSVIEFEIDTPDPDYINYRAYKWYLSAYNPLNCSF